MDTITKLFARLATEGTRERPERPEGGGIMSGHVEGRGRVYLAVTAAEQAAIDAEHAAKMAARAAKLPDEKACLEAMFEAYDRLRELGWRDAIYCPKDGTVFLSISAGSTGIHECYYQGEWPKGSWWSYDAGDIWPAHPILWKAKP
jgi:hypothetical protein